MKKNGNTAKFATSNSATANWRMIRADAVMEFKNGLNFSADQVGTGIPVVGVGDFGTDFRLPNREFGRVQIGNELDDSYILNNQDLLFCRSNGNKALVGRVLYVEGTTERTSHSGFTIRGRVTSSEFLPVFAAYYFSSSLVKQQFLTLGGGTNISNLSQQMLKSVEVPLPPLPEQQKIAAILSTWDRAIELTEKLIAAKQKRKQALVQHLLTKPMLSVRNDEPVKGWNPVRLGSLIERQTATSCDLETYPLHSFTIEHGVTAKTDRYERSFLLADRENNQYSIVRFGDFVANPMNLRFGAIGRSRIDLPVTVSAYYDVFSMSNPVCDAKFLEHVLKSPLLYHVYETVATGSLIEKRRVHYSEFQKIVIPLPSIQIQTEIALTLDAVDVETSLLRKKVDLLKLQKKGLMQQLLTGKVRVRLNINNECGAADD